MPRPSPVQPRLWTLLTPKWRSALVRSREEHTDSRGRFLLLGFVALLFWIAVFGIAFRVLRYFRSVEDIGNLMAGKVLDVILLAFLTILLLSNIITALSTFFLAKDLDLLVAAPVGGVRLYLAKLAETVVHSSWMVALLALPIFTAYGIVYKGGLLFPFVALAAFIPYLVLPAVVGTALTLLLVNVFPARRTSELLGLIATGAVVIVLVSLRFLRPEQLAQPEGFRNLVDYLAALRTPTSAFLPSEWTASMVMNWLLHVAIPGRWPSSGAAARRGCPGGLAPRTTLFPGLLQSAGRGRAARSGGRSADRCPECSAGCRPPEREFILKDLRLFFRDNTQWSQLILLAVLLMVYLFNIKSLPLHSGERVPFRLVTLISFLNLGLAGFVLAAVAARFVFPAISLEGRQMWLLRSSPLDPRAMLWSKYWMGTIPLLVLALIDHGLHQLAPARERLHDGGGRQHHRSLYPGRQRAGAVLRRALPAVRNRERRTDPHQLRRPGLHDEQPVPAGADHHDRGWSGDRLSPGSALRRAAGRHHSSAGGTRGSWWSLICVAATIIPLRLGLRRIETMEW